MKKFYVGSSLKNIDTVSRLSKILIQNGFVNTYDWTQNKSVSTIEELKNIGLKELEAVIDSDFVVVILPAGKGSNIELGIAIGRGKKIFLYSPNQEVNEIEKTTTFYHLPEVTKCYGAIEDVVEEILQENRKTI